MGKSLLTVAILFACFYAQKIDARGGGNGINYSPEEYRKLPGGNYLTNVNGKFVVPSLVGQNVDDADFLKKVQLGKFTYKILAREENNGLAKGTVIRQIPEANSLVDKPMTITIIVALGPK